MWTLALETTTPLGSLALLRDEEVAAERTLEAGNYAAAVFWALEEVLTEAGVKLDDVELLAVADGPGSFTGVRVGLSVVKGIAETLGTPVVAVSTLRAVAGDGPWPTLAALDAGQGEAYFGMYPESEEGVATLAGLRERLERTPMRAVTPQAALQAACPGFELVGARLAAAVARAGLAQHRAGVAQDVMRLDARYLRRAEAELHAALTGAGPAPSAAPRPPL